MKIQEKDIYHGSALTQIVEHDEFKALNRATSKYGHYVINADRTIHIRHSAARRSPWTYTIKEEDCTVITDDITAGKNVFIVLVAGSSTVCALNQDEIDVLLDRSGRDPQWLRLDVPRGGSIRVSGSRGSLSRVVPHSVFPAKLFE
ncbi:MAG: hypothetical protein ABSE59_11840 [Opitutaceae bacterium]|jgi:hypothetical protein